MSSSTRSSHRDRLCLARKIQSDGDLAVRPCRDCHSLGRACIVMPPNDRLKCSECTRRGRPCVDMSWDSVERTKDLLKDDVRREEEAVLEMMRQLLERQARLARKRKLLEQAQQRSDEQMECLIREMEAGGEDLTRRTADDALAASALEVELFPNGWPDPILPTSGDAEPVAAEVPSS